MDSNRNFLDYINTQLSKESLLIIYDTNNIKFEKCELYCDFIQSLLMLIFDTYLGDDMMTNENQLKHFDWCWKKNIENFKKEGFSFDNPILYNYFKDYVNECFYSIEEKQIKEYIFFINDLWAKLFDYENKKTSFDIDFLVEIYNLFNKSLVVKD